MDRFLSLLSRLVLGRDHGRLVAQVRGLVVGSEKRGSEAKLSEHHTVRVRCITRLMIRGPSRSGDDATKFLIGLV
ncbi:hypothetical protein IGI04_006570 [Brassica rapa subsp. trilocularis]|uniref:Secreted protein n=1 Tax=Brassica rapa subsp. trilocularis TaxID=1813537 RepID=A0ABQ7NH95_BRACM|nr:hypothetical protein IGI04_006570 [Brassica rapa subsp. trilocularis]